MLKVALLGAGRIGQVHAVNIATHPSSTLTAVADINTTAGAEGLLQAQNVLENAVVKSTTSGVTGAKPTYFFLERYMPAYAAEWGAFVDAVGDGQPMPVTVEDGVAALAMAEAATLSAQTATPVRLDEV